jgi:4-aminobutyrate aminotransferase
MGDLLSGYLEELVSRYEFFGWVSGKGLMTGLEIVKDKDSCTPDPQKRNRIVQHCFEERLLLLGCGPSAIRFSPPLVVKKREIEIAVEILDAAAKKVSRGGRK